MNDYHPFIVEGPFLTLPEERNEYEDLRKSSAMDSRVHVRPHVRLRPQRHVDMREVREDGEVRK